MAQPFDARSVKTTGEAGPVAEKVDYDGAFEMGLFSGSAEGTLVYLSGAFGNAKKDESVHVTREHEGSID